MLTGWIVPGNSGLDAIALATPLSYIQNSETVNQFDLSFDFHSGSIGECSILFILSGAVYLIITKTAILRIILSTFLRGSAGSIPAKRSLLQFSYCIAAHLNYTS
jgi:Na+-transporting NADH:ubiquinone oxidoreductase subunit B